MASDGFWDVVSVETVRCVGLSDKYKYVTLIFSILQFFLFIFILDCNQVFCNFSILNFRFLHDLLINHPPIEILAY